jgi:tetratricopeptide (TPR) repeat protein
MKKHSQNNRSIGALSNTLSCLTLACSITMFSPALAEEQKITAASASLAVLPATTKDITSDTKPKKTSRQCKSKFAIEKSAEALQEEKITKLLKLPSQANQYDSARFEVELNSKGYPTKFSLTKLNQDPGVIEATVSALVAALPFNLPANDLQAEGTKLEFSVIPDAVKPLRLKRVQLSPDKKKSREPLAKQLANIADLSKASPEGSRIYSWQLNRLACVLNLAQDYPDSPEIHKATDACMISVGAKPDNPDCWISIGKGLASAAVRHIYSPGKEDAIADIEKQGEKLDKALFAVSQALNLKDHAVTRLFLKQVLLAKAAIPYMATPESDSLKHAIGYELLGDPCLAEDLYQTAKQVNPQEKDAAKLLKRINDLLPLLEAGEQSPTGQPAVKSTSIKQKILLQKKDWQSLLPMLPADTETIIYSQQTNNYLPEFEPFYKQTFNSFLTSLPGWSPPAVPRAREAWKFPTSKFKLFVARQFKPPLNGQSKIRSGSFEGATIEVYTQEDLRLANRAFSDACKQATVTRKFSDFTVYLIPHLAENGTTQKCIEYLVSPVPGMVIRANSPLFLAQMLWRLEHKNNEREQAFSLQLPEWKVIDTGKPVWGIRHFNKNIAASDLSTVIWNDNGKEEWLYYNDLQPTGIGFDCSSDGHISIIYLSQDKIAQVLRQAQWQQLNRRSKHTIELSQEKDQLLVKPQSTRPKEAGLILMKALGFLVDI